MVQMSNMQQGQEGRIVNIDPDMRAVSRMTALGFVPGANVKVVGVAPLGDPIIVEVGMNQVSLRREDASALGVECN